MNHPRPIFKFLTKFYTVLVAIDNRVKDDNDDPIIVQKMVS